MGKAAPIVNRVEVGHQDERADCAMSALACYLDVSYTDTIRLATVMDSHHGKRGLWPATMIRIAADFGFTLRRQKLTEDSYGIILVPGHAAVVRQELVIDRNTIWPLDVWLAQFRCRPSKATVLSVVE